MDDLEFWEVEGPVAEWQAWYLAALRRELCPPYLECSRDDESLLFVLDIDADDVALLTVGLEIRPASVRGDKVHNQLYEFPDAPTELAFDATGDRSELLLLSVRWVKDLVARPVVRHEWLYDGRVYASCYLFSDNGKRLTQMYRPDWAPPAQPEQLIRDGYVFGKGWIQTRGLGEPDRVVPVRG